MADISKAGETAKLDIKLAATNIFPTIFRYLVLIGLYVIVFSKIRQNSLQFILFIVIFVLNFFTIIFMARDILATQQLVKNIYGLYSPGDETTPYYNPLSKFFVIIMLATALLFVCSLSIILAVFDYGKKTTNNFKSYTMTPANTELLNKFKDSFRVYMVYLCLFVFFIIYSHTEGPTRQLMFNAACILMSLILLITSIYCCVAAVRFLKIRQNNRQLYQ